MKRKEKLKIVLKSRMRTYKSCKLSTKPCLHLYSKSSKSYDKQWQHYLDQFEKWIYWFPFTNTHTLSDVFDAWYNDTFKSSNINSTTIWGIIENDCI